MNAIQIPEIKSLIWTELSNKALGSLTNDSDITELATQIINYSQVSKDWQTAFKDTLNSIKKLQIEKQYLGGLRFYFESVPLVNSLNNSCMFNGSPILFRVLYDTSKKNPLNLHKLQHVCKLFSNIVNSKHLSYEEKFGYCLYFDVPTRVTLLKFACQLYINKEEEYFPLKTIKTLIENGAEDDISSLINDFNKLAKLMEPASLNDPELMNKFKKLNYLLILKLVQESGI